MKFSFATNNCVVYEKVFKYFKPKHGTLYEISHPDDENMSTFNNNVVKNVWYLINFMEL